MVETAQKKLSGHAESDGIYFRFMAKLVNKGTAQDSC